MKVLDLNVPKKMYLVDFLAKEEKRMQEEEKQQEEIIKNAWILMHDTIIAQLGNEGFKRKRGIHNYHILYRYTKKVLEEIIIADVPFRNYSAVVAFRDNKNGSFEESYDTDMITTVPPKYLILLKA